MGMQWADDRPGRQEFKSVPQAECKHPPARYYSWTAYDGVLCIGCCDCGKILKGALK